MTSFLLITLSILATANLVLGLHLLRFKYKNKKILQDNSYKITYLEASLSSSQSIIKNLEQILEVPRNQINENSSKITSVQDSSNFPHNKIDAISKNLISFEEDMKSTHNSIKNIVQKKILEDEKNGRKTIVITETKINLWGEFRQHLEIIKIIKKNIPNLNIVFYTNKKYLNTFKCLFQDIIDDSFITFSESDSDIKQDKIFLQSLKPFLLFCLGPNSNVISFPNQFVPAIEVTSHPYMKYLMLDKNHNYYIRVIARNLDKIKNLSIESKQLLFVRQNLKPLLLEKRNAEFNKIEVTHKEVYNKHIVQFTEFRTKYERIIVFCFINLNNVIKDGMAFFRDFLAKLPKNYLIIFTIHPQYHFSRESLDTANHNTDFDINLHYEIKGKKGDYKPMEILKSEFPNFITEFDLEIKKIHTTPELPSLTNFIIQYSDAVICSPASKVVFNAMESDKPVFGYFKNEADISFKVLELEAKDIVTYDFTKQTPSELYNKIFHFMFTRILHKHLFGADKDFQKFYDFIDYENEKIAKGINVFDFDFYGRENQTIEEVYDIIKNA
jgi:hypothetical protein